MVKTDSAGNKEWDKRFGTGASDDLIGVSQGDDGGFVLLGLSYTGINGDKFVLGWGGADYWTIKTDSLGNMQWENSFGGSSDDLASYIVKAPDGGFLLAGISNSGISGIKSEASRSGFNDVWLVKLNSFGTVQWDRTFGCYAGENFVSDICPTADHGFIVSLTTQSDSCIDKSENNLGHTNAWLIKIDSVGNKEWDKTLLTTGGFSWNPGPTTLEVGDNSYVIANSENSGIGGDKSQPNWDGIDSTNDFWIIKLVDIGISNTVHSENNNFNFSVSPNPSNDFIEVQFEIPFRSEGEIELYDLFGKKVKYKKRIFEQGPNKFQLSLQDLPEGVFPLLIRIKGVTFRGKILKLQE